MTNNKNVKGTLEAGGQTKRHSEGIRPKNPLHILKRFFAKYKFPFAGNYIRPAQNDCNFLVPLTQDPTPKSKISTLSHTARSFTRLASSSVQLVPQGAGIHVMHLADFGKCAVRVARQRAQHVYVKNLMERSNSDSGYEVECKGFETPIIQDFTYSLINLFTFKKQAAFTLAEVLITLGVIGVVAAMTIPNLIADYHKKQTVAQLKETYSIIQQAMKLSQEENGEVESWDTTLTGHEFFNKYVANYVKVMKEYSTSELKNEVQRKQLNGSNYSGTTYNWANSTHISLINGSMVSMNLNSSAEAGLWVAIDVNGISKPNTIGKDTFLFFLSSEYGLRPLGDQGSPSPWRFPNGIYNRKIVTGKAGNTSLACNKTKSGYWCSALIMMDGWKISADYPW